LPFQCSASTPVALLPTAVQSVADTHDTPDSAVLFARFDWMIDHLLPFQCSTSVPSAPTPAPGAPTAVQSVADTHDTASSSLERDPDALDPDALGDGTIDQTVPFHCSTSVKWSLSPTAVQSVADTHDTPPSPPPLDGVADGTIDHRSALTATESAARDTARIGRAATATCDATNTAARTIPTNPTRPRSPITHPPSFDPITQRGRLYHWV
jgi:hypothetical protein